MNTFALTPKITLGSFLNAISNQLQTAYFDLLMSSIPGKRSSGDEERAAADSEHGDEENSETSSLENQVIDRDEVTGDRGKRSSGGEE